MHSAEVAVNDSAISCNSQYVRLCHAFLVPISFAILGEKKYSLTCCYIKNAINAQQIVLMDFSKV